MGYKKQIIGKEAAIKRMNTWGNKKKPFLFILSFNQKENLILSDKQAADAGIFYDIGDRSNHSSKPAQQYGNQTDEKADERDYTVTQQHRIKDTKKIQIAPGLPSTIIFNKKAISEEDFCFSFNVVKNNLDFGNTYLINLTKPSQVNTNLSLEQIFYHAHAPYKLWIRNKLVVFSPEIFVKVKNGTIASYPMKGTIDASLPHAEEQILNNPKETAEHHTIVDLIRNDLSMVSKNVRVKRFRYFDKIITSNKNLLQVSSEIVGEISADFFGKLGTHLFRLLPAGSISGAPKTKTLEVIKEAEHYERGFYTGVFGYFDGESVDSAVMIRYMEMHDEKMIFKSGGGITTFSDCKKEYQELKDKIYVPIDGNFTHS